MAEILNAHGSKNDIFVAAMTPRDFASGGDLRAFVRHLCDRGGVVEVDAVPAERAAPVAQAADEGAQVVAGGKVARRHRDHEDVVLRAVRVQDLGHPGQPIRALGVLQFQALKASCHPEALNSAGPAGPNAG